MIAILTKYLADSFGIDLQINSIEHTKLERLPLYLKGGFEFYQASFIEVKMIFAKPKSDNHPTPGQLEKQQSLLQANFSAIIVFILDDLDPYERKRLIGKKIAFVQIERQLYIPQLLIELSDVRTLVKSKNPKSTFTMLTQCAVLYHLQISSIEGMPMRDIAKLLITNAMSISRIVKELEQHELITIEGTKGKRIYFNAKGKKAIWAATKDLMSSPIKEILYTDYPIEENPNTRLSYDSALARYSNLNESRQISYAISKADFTNLQKDIELKLETSPNFGKYRLETWVYSPSAFSNEKMIDPLSLYLTLRDNEDERVKMALDEMINNIKW